MIHDKFEFLLKKTSSSRKTRNGLKIFQEPCQTLTNMLLMQRIGHELFD